MIPEILRPFLGNSFGAAALFYGGILVALAILSLIGWQWFGVGPRRRRALQLARQKLAKGDWQQARDQLKVVRGIGIPTMDWVKQFDQFDAECLDLGGKAALREKKFEEGLELALQASHLREGMGTDARLQVQSEMLREIRRLFATGRPEDLHGAMDLIARTLMVQSPCREASFWLGMCDIRLDQMDTALASLQVARTGQFLQLNLEEDADEPQQQGTLSPYIDPPLYLGTLLMRQGKAKEALRYLTEANRLDSNCPIITVQLGAAMIEAGGDPQLAVRALQRGLGSKGLEQWKDTPEKAWTGALPEHHSYVRKLASEFAYTCPIWGANLARLAQHGNLALAKGHFRMGNFQEAAHLFDKLLKEGATSLDVSRGLGISLAKTGKFDDAFPHLRVAQELESPNNQLTVGYLTLSAALANTKTTAEKTQNVSWAVHTLQKFSALGDPEWANILNHVFAEARQHNVPLGSQDQVYLCEHLSSVYACDPMAAQAYHQLFMMFPEQVRPDYSWLYCRADEQHQVGGPQVLDLYAAAFRNREAAQHYFEERGWKFSELEYAYLYRAADLAPGNFPEGLGVDAALGERKLLDRSEQLSQAGKFEEATLVIDVLAKLAPHNAIALDRLAAIHFRNKKPERAIELLEQWCRARPDDPVPLVRLALTQHRQQRTEAALRSLRRALELAGPTHRAPLAWIGAKMAIQNHMAASESSQPSGLQQAMELLRECLEADPRRTEALWTLAAIHWLNGDSAELSRLAETMASLDSADPRYHFLSALSSLVAGQSDRTLAACQRTRETGRGNRYTTEVRLLEGLAWIAQGRHDEAMAALQPLAATSNSPTQPLAQANEGVAAFRAGHHESAVQSWQSLDPKLRQAWKLAEPLGQTMFLDAVQSILDGDYEEGAEKLRSAGRSGCRDRRLGPLLLLSLFKAGQQAVYADETARITT